MRQNTENVSPMSNEGRNAYVIERITHAMLELLAQKSIDDISISELTDQAQVGRASFYRNYNSKEAVLKTYLEKLFHEWTVDLDDDNKEPLSEKLRGMIAHFEKNRSFYALLHDRGLLYLLKDTIISAMELHPECEKAEAYAKAFAAYALYGWIETWFQRGMAESADEMAELFKRFGL